MMTFTEALKSVFRKFVSIDGRASRAEYWWFMAFVTGMFLLLDGLGALLFGHIPGQNYMILSGIFALLVMFPLICVSIRRLHDRDLRGWWFLFSFTGIGGLVLLVIYCLKGTPGPNRFGPDPLER